ncbi:MAG TPA: hypothetical protein VFF50_05480 [Candidatus Deferrimicrobiaceae bacterium]|jgi:hypothetical protein|nr:hypothetical protein [Candidatus Deferrimicrobiaceae bacterium]
MLVLLIAVLLASPGWAMGQNNADAIIQRSVEANKRDWEAAPQFDCLEQDRDGNGTRSYEDTMILGSPYQRLVAINGNPLTPAQTAAEKQKLENTVSERKKESRRQRANRVAKYKKEQRRNHLLMEQIAKAFAFNQVGEANLDGHEVYVLKATPRPGYRPPNMETEALTGMEGKLWIDTSSFQWVKVEAQVTHPVHIAGFLAEVEPGTHFELEQEPVAPGIWLPQHFSMRASSRILFVVPHHGQEDDTYSDCHAAHQN